MSCLASSEKYLLDRIRTYILSSSTKLSLSYWCSQIPWELQPRSWLTEPLRFDFTSSGLFWRLTTLAIFTRGGFASAEEIQITSLKKKSQWRGSVAIQDFDFKSPKEVRWNWDQLHFPKDLRSSLLSSSSPSSSVLFQNWPIFFPSSTSSFAIRVRLLAATPETERERKRGELGQRRKGRNKKTVLCSPFVYAHNWTTASGGVAFSGSATAAANTISFYDSKVHQLANPDLRSPTVENEFFLANCIFDTKVNDRKSLFSRRNKNLFTIENRKTEKHRVLLFREKSGSGSECDLHKTIFILWI